MNESSGFLESTPTPYDDPWSSVIPIPPYVKPDAWQVWDAATPCPAGYTCTVLGNETLGAFSCDEMARIAHDEFGFGNVLAGTYCPEGEMNLLNCKKGGYCPDSMTRNICPEGLFCPYKTFGPSDTGGAVPCSNCPAGAENKRLNRTEKIAYSIAFTLLCLFIIFMIIRRKAGINREKLKQKIHFDSISTMREQRSLSRKMEVTPGQEKYAQLRGKLDVISTRLGKIHQDRGKQAHVAPLESGSPVTLEQQKTILYLNWKGNIVFDANEFYNVLDTDKDGTLSFAEINTVLCLDEEQLEAFVASMRDRMPADYRPEQQDKVGRITFVKNFLGVLADVYHLEPTAEEVESLFLQISEEVGTTESGEIVYENLYLSSTLSSMLNEVQICAIIRKFKQQGLEFSAASIGTTGRKREGISKDEFVKLYPLFLRESSQAPGSEVEGGLDVAFKNLSLTVDVGGKKANVVDSVTGRLRSNTMTAVMGGSGSGKSSLLNALCGRAYYGEVTGEVKINGNDALIEEHKAVIGFVPQDDIVFPELTVRENLLYSGRLLSSSGTTEREISELADTTMASLGLSRIANSIVGDATRRGISGGEKKRVNIGLELMKKPKILFLDEPTSGLDSRSAFVVMDSLKNLVKTQGMTVASVIHQPRTDIYDMFDSLFLLGVGGRTVYHGPAADAQSYFADLGFEMQHGESQADWFLDISSGDIELSNDIEAGGPLEEESDDHDHLHKEDKALAKARIAREKLYRKFRVYFENLPLAQRTSIYDPPEAFPLPVSPKAVPSWSQFIVQFRRNSLLSRRNLDSRTIDFGILVIAVFLMTLLSGHGSEKWNVNPKDLLWVKFIASPKDASIMLNPLVFRYAIRGIMSIITYSMMAGLIICVLMGLSATKIITDKRLEFFREAQSGANTTAYYIAAMATATLEQGFGAFAASILAFGVLNPRAPYWVYLWNFFMLSWLSVSWSLILSVIIPQDSVTTVVGFFNAFFGLLFCGQLAPGTFKNLYSKPVLAVFAGFVSPLRYFVEGIAVSEARCLPQQSGFTVSDDAFNFPEFTQSYPYAGMTHMAQTDQGTAIDQSCSGWFWWVPAALAVGATLRIVGGVAIHFSNRSKQGKKSFREEFTDDFNKCRAGTKPILQSFILASILVTLLFAGFFALSCWLILRENPVDYDRFIKPIPAVHSYDSVGTTEIM